MRPKPGPDVIQARAVMQSIFDDNRALREAMEAKGERFLSRSVIRDLMLSGVVDLAAHLGRPLRFIERCFVRGLTSEVARHRAAAEAKATRRIECEQRKAERRAYWARYREERKEDIIRSRAVLSTRGNAIRRIRMLLAFKEVVKPDVVFAQSGGKCGICGLELSRSEMHVDHVVPLARGGEHSYANVQAAHRKCNIRKGAR